MSEFKEELKLTDKVSVGEKPEKDWLKQDVIDENGLTHKDNKFLEVLFDECKGNIKDAMKISGIAGSQTAITKRLGKQIKELTSEYLIANTARAAIGVVSVIDHPNVPGNKDILSAAGMILDRGGVVKKEEVVVQEQNFMFILPSKDKDES